MTPGESSDATDSAASRWLAYGLVGVGLPAGLLVVLLQPLPWPALNYLVGGAFLAVAVGSVTHLVAQHSGPGERGPDF